MKQWLACACALDGQTAKALKHLQAAVDQGFTNLSLMKTDPDLASLRKQSDFQGILESVNSLENNPEARRFDFWVGEWRVVDASGVAQGTSSIVKILKNNIILENWTGRSGYTGMSFNHYVLSDSIWVQYWVDQNGAPMYFQGNYDPDQQAMVFYSANPGSISLPLRRLRFFDQGVDQLRQLSEQSSDGGRSWTVEYDFRYHRKR